MGKQFSLINLKIDMEKENKSKPKGTYFIDWMIYSIISVVLISPFFKDFQNEWQKLFGLSFLLGFFLGMLNRLVRELVDIKKLLITTQKKNNEEERYHL